MRTWWVVLATMSCSFPSSEAKTVPDPTPPPTALAAEVVGPQACPSEAIPTVAEATVKSVVSVFTRRSPSVSRLPHPFAPFGMPPSPRETGGLGSGVIVEASGLVVTNHHVVERADSIRVALHDGREFKAELVGSDPGSDLAVLRMEEAPSDLEALHWGQSRELRLGETVLAVGNPFGIGHSVTQGIVSAIGRGEVGIVDYEEFIQTDASINPGNSGGALVDLQGNLVGINTAIMSRSGGSQGIGFAIPAHLAKRVVADLVDDGKTNRGFLGVAIQNVTPDLQEAMSLPDTQGVLIAEVSPEGAADAAGVRAGDVVRTLDNASIRSAGDFRNRVALGGAGQSFEMEVLREGRSKTLRGVFGEHPDDAERGSSLLGLQFEVEGKALVVTEVEPNSAAGRVGLRSGDRILQVDGGAPTEKRMRAALQRGQALLLTERNGSQRFLVLRE